MNLSKTSYSRRVHILSFRRTNVRRNDEILTATKKMEIFHKFKGQ